MKVLNMFQCKICSRISSDYETINECESRGEEKIDFKVGDIVSKTFCYAWFDGKKQWVINLGGKKTKTMGFFYVVTAIDNMPEQHDGHRKRIHIETKAMSGGRGHRGGWIGSSNIKKIKNPPKYIKRNSRDLIGNKFNFLM